MFLLCWRSPTLTKKTWKIIDWYPTSVFRRRSLRRPLHVNCILTSPEQKLWGSFSQHTGNLIQWKLRCWKFILISYQLWDQGKVAALTLLDLSTAFYTIDHSMLLGQLEDWVGVTGRVHNWLRSYLTGRSQQVKLGECLSRKVDLPFGVPQGSVLGPLLFTICTTPLSQVVSQHDISHHVYANDSQLYVSFSPHNSAVLLSSLKSCLDSVQLWMSGTKLKLNPDKTEFLLIGHEWQRSKYLAMFPVDLLGVKTTSAKAAWNLGGIFDLNFSFCSHISAVCRSCHYHIGDLRHLILQNYLHMAWSPLPELRQFASI